MTLSSEPQVSHPKVVVVDHVGVVYSTTNGVEVDLSAQLSSILFASLSLYVTSPNLPPGWYPVFTFDAPSPGRLRYRLFRPRYMDTSVPGAVTGPPSGVAVRNASGTEAAGVNALSGTGNAHTVNQLYEHTHSATRTETNLLGVELTSGTNLTAARFKLLAVGV